MSANSIKEDAILNNEISFLGLLLREEKAFNEISEIIKPEMFHFPQNRVLYQAICDLQLSSSKFDVSNLISYIEEKKLAPQISILGKAAFEYIEWLIQNGGYYAELDTYAKKIIDQFKTEKILTLLNNNIDIINNKSFDIGDLINEIQLSLINIDVSEVNSAYTTLKEEADEFVSKIINHDENDKTGLKFGFPELDAILLGVNPGDLIIIGARPSVGKTAFALNIANKVSSYEGHNVLFFSLEMTTQQLVQRIISIETIIPITSLRTARLKKDEWGQLQWALQSFGKRNLYFNDKSALTISDISTLAKRFARNKQIDLIIVDYLQLISDSTRSRNDNRQLEVAKICRTLKQLARELKCPIIALSQLSRNVEKREDKIPVMSDLSESGKIEADADVVLFLHRDDYYQTKKMVNEDGNEDKPTTLPTNVVVAKNRNGATGMISLIFEAKTNRFYYAARDINNNKLRRDE